MPYNLPRLRGRDRLTQSLNQVFESVEANRRMDGGGYVAVSRDGQNQGIYDASPPRILARISGGSNPYSFQEVIYANLGGGVTLYETGRYSGTTTVNPLYELNGLTTVPALSIVEAWLDPANERWYFAFSGESIPLEVVYARLTGGAAHIYGWVEIEPSGAGWIDKVGGMSGTTAISPAIEINDTIDIPSGTRVFLWPGNRYTPAINISTIQNGDGASLNEIQSFYFTGTQGGTFTLTFEGQTTASISYGAAAAAVETALEALSNLTSVTVTGSGTFADPYIVTFNDDFSNQDQMTADDDNLLPEQDWRFAYDYSADGIDFDDFYSSTVLAVDHKAQYYTEQLGATVTLTLATGTITMAPNGTIAPAYLDGGTASIGTRILYNEGREAAGNSLNGILVFTSVGSSSTAVTLVRATDYDSATEITPGSKVTVTDGDEFHDKTFILKNDGTVTVNTTDLIFDLHAEKQDIGWSSLILASGDEAVVVLPHICRQIRVSTSEVKFQMQGVEPVKERTRRVLWNVGSETIIVKHQNSSATAEWRIICATGQDLILYPNGLCFLEYDDTTDRWRAAVISDRLAATKNVTADQAPLDLELNRLLRLVPDANLRLIQGIRQLPAPADGFPLRIRDEATLTNDGTFTLALTHADGAVSAHERIICPGGTSFELRPSEAVAVVRDNSGSGWNILSMSRNDTPGSITVKDHNSASTTISSVLSLSFENRIVDLSTPGAGQAKIDFTDAANTVAGVINAGSSYQHLGDGPKGMDTLGLGGTPGSFTDSGRGSPYPAKGSACTGVNWRQGTSGAYLDFAVGSLFWDGSVSSTTPTYFFGPQQVSTLGVLGSDLSNSLNLLTGEGLFTFSGESLDVRPYDNTGAMGLGISGGATSYPFRVALHGLASSSAGGWRLYGTSTQTSSNSATVSLSCAYGASHLAALDIQTEQGRAFLDDQEIDLTAANHRFRVNSGSAELQTTGSPDPQIIVRMNESGGPGTTFTKVLMDGIAFCNRPSLTVYGGTEGPGIYAHDGKMFGADSISKIWELGHQFTALGQVGGYDGTYNRVCAAPSANGMVLTSADSEDAGFEWTHGVSGLASAPTGDGQIAVFKSGVWQLVPAAPGTDGTYTLQCTVSGTGTIFNFDWV